MLCCSLCPHTSWSSISDAHTCTRVWLLCRRACMRCLTLTRHIAQQHTRRHLLTALPSLPLRAIRMSSLDLTAAPAAADGATAGGGPQQPVTAPAAHQQQRTAKQPKAKQPSDGSSAASTASQPQRSKQPKQPRTQNVNKSAAPSAAAPSSAAAASGLQSVLSHPSFPSLQLCDIGANLLDDMFNGRYHGSAPKHPPDLPAVLERAWARACTRIIVTAGCAKEGREVQRLITTLEAQARAEQRTFPQLFATVGVHPTRSNLWNGSEQHQQQYFNSLLQCILDGLGGDPALAGSAAASSTSAALAAAASVSSPAVPPPSPRQVVVAIGECGLDYDRLHFSDKASQLRHFAKHFELCERVVEATKAWKGGPVHLPLFLHDRNTGGDFESIVRANRHRFRHGVVHSFTGSIEEVQALLALDLHIGINGCSLKTEANLAVLEHIPLNRLMLETDAPCSLPCAKTPDKWQAGQGVKSRNEPGCMVQVLEVVSAKLGMDPIQLAHTVWQNTMEVFFTHEQATQTGTPDKADC